MTLHPNKSALHPLFKFSGLLPAAAGLLVLILCGPASADYDRRQPHGYQGQTHTPQTHHQPHEHHNFYFEREHHHRHPHCREQLVPYWDSYWGIWSQRIERRCW